MITYWLANVFQEEEKDAFCWSCHKEGSNLACELCSRSFHLKCLDMNHACPNWVCGECEVGRHSLHGFHLAVQIRPPLNKKSFTVHRPDGLKRANWNFFFPYFSKSFSFVYSPLYTLGYKNEIRGEKTFPALPAGRFFAHPAHRKRFFT